MRAERIAKEKAQAVVAVSRSNTEGGLIFQLGLNRSLTDILS